MGCDPYECARPRIAVVGWGSLIWDQGDLQTRSCWQTDGPELPVEFARVSSDGRLTLVLQQGVSDVQTLWAVTSDEVLETYREQLRLREGRTRLEYIGSLDGEGGGCVSTTPAAARRRLTEWLADRPLDGVVWTALPSNFEAKTSEPPSVEAAVRHLGQLVGNARVEAERYVRNTPRQVRTVIRQGLERELRWTPLMD
jgi:hypothetical protein